MKSDQMRQVAEANGCGELSIRRHGTSCRYQIIK